MLHFLSVAQWGHCRGQTDTRERLDRVEGRFQRREGGTIAIDTTSRAPKQASISYFSKGSYGCSPVRTSRKQYEGARFLSIFMQGSGDLVSHVR